MWQMKPYFMTAAITLLLCLGNPAAYAGKYTGFKKLKPGNCMLLEKQDASRLPPVWQKFTHSIRLCPLEESAKKAAKVSIVTVWLDDYYAGLPSDAPWEEFPKPLIVDQDFRVMGTLPELYPVDDPREADLYYGKWQDGIPLELRMDISNPAVSGDYHYPPIRFQKASGTYTIQNGEVTYGRRR